MSRKCRNCQIEKPIANYAIVKNVTRHNTISESRRRICITCCKDRLHNYYKNNKDKFQGGHKRYQQKNSDRFIDCPCGSRVKFLSKYHHLKSKKHLAFIKDNN